MDGWQHEHKTCLCVAAKTHRTAILPFQPQLKTVLFTCKRHFAKIEAIVAIFSYSVVLSFENVQHNVDDFSFG